MRCGCSDVRRLGKYKVCGLLGRGGMARVYKVRLPVIGKVAALKRLEPRPELEALIGEARLRALFTAEARTMAGMRHPNLVQVLDYGTAGGRPFYVMAFHAVNLGDVIGETYRAEAPSRILRLDRAVDYTRQVLDGLARLHFGGVIHRDVKPFNLLITEDDRVQIGDFGLSKLRGERFGGPSNLKIGSPFYTAPEQESTPDDVGPAADLFSVGVMLLRMLTSRLPEGASHPPSRMNPDLDPSWDEFFKKAAAPRPEDRFDSAAQMKTALETLYAAWQKRQERICTIDAAPGRNAAAQSAAGRRTRRQTPVKVRPGAARDFFGLDALWRPKRYAPNRFEAQAPGTVFDAATRLLWEQAGTPYPVSWQEAHRHVAEKNRQRYAGRTDWRLPTVDELLTLLSAPPHGADFCIDSQFEETQRRLWTCDRASFISAWYIDAQLGFVHRHDFEAPFYARAVCTAEGK